MPSVPDPRTRLFNIKTTPSEMERLRDAAAARETTMASLIRAALAAYGVDLNPRREGASA